MTTERNDLIAELWAQALVEGQGVRGVGQRMAELVAEECARIAVEVAHRNGAYSLAAYEIRERFGLPKE